MTSLVLAALTGALGYLAVAGLVGVESVGIPVPGETALITAAVLARSGQMQIVLVIVAAAVGAILGDNLGYTLGRSGGRALLERPGRLEKRRRELLEKGQPFFDRHGAPAVFLGRWVSGLRIAAAWLAGINHMRWRVFFFWNALGGIAWATSIGLLAYLLGPAVERVIKAVGLGGIAVVVVLVVGVLLVRWLRARRASAPAPHRTSPPAPGSTGTLDSHAGKERLDGEAQQPSSGHARQQPPPSDQAQP